MGSFTRTSIYCCLHTNLTDFSGQPCDFTSDSIKSLVFELTMAVVASVRNTVDRLDKPSSYGAKAVS